MIKNKNKNNKKSEEFQEIYGTHSVLAALKNPKRRHFSIYILEKYKELIGKHSRNIGKINILNNTEMTKLFGSEKVNQGIVLKSSPLPVKQFNEIFKIEKLNEISVVVVLDNITDPYNIGSIMRSCSLFKCNTIILPKNNAPNITPTLSKASSGAIEIVNFVKVTNMKRSLQELKKLGYWIYGLDSGAESNFKINDLSKKSVLVFGSEGKGMRDIIKKECDMLVAIHSAPNETYKIDSLNVSNACAITLYQHFIKYN